MLETEQAIEHDQLEKKEFLEQTATLETDMNSLEDKYKLLIEKIAKSKMEMNK